MNMNSPAGIHRGKAAKTTCAAIILLWGSLVLVPSQAQQPATAAAAPASTTAQPVLTIRDAAQQAVLNNPEVMARLHGVRAALGERDAVRGGLYPRVDLTAGVGPESRSSVNGQYTRSNATLSLTQLLYDGFATLRDVRRLDHAARVRVFELLATSEGVALEAARAYYDVIRFRELVQLAEENFVEHRAVFAQTDQRVKARIARAVDLEQITGRLALAEANLLIETSNLHDTTARFQRIVGRMPGRQMPLPAHLAVGLPGNSTAALVKTIETNANLLASVENVRAASAALETRNSAYHPRLDLRVKRDQGRNIDGIPGNSNANVVELVLNWNLFNGFSDRARERQFAEQLNIARDVRDKTCRDTRQTTAIAYNDIVKLKEQIEYLTLHDDSLSKALVAYRQQFQIGQRTLLDLLDTENERFQARRAVVNARHDLNIAFVRTQAGIGTLLQALQLSSLESGMEADLRSWTSGGDAAQQCPPEAVALYAVDKNALVQRALQQVVRTPMISIEPRPAAEPAAPIAATATATAVAAATPAPAAPAAAVPTDEQALRAAVESWRAAWARRDVEAYLQAYAPTFAPSQDASRVQWSQKRRAIIGKAANVAVELSDVTVTLAGGDKASTAFSQAYRSASYQDKVRKTLEWQRIEGRWQIVREVSEP
jgi:adhesin transport system outer membrane protein